MTAVTVDKKGADMPDLGPVFNTLTDLGVDPKVITKLICCRRPGCSVSALTEQGSPFPYIPERTRSRREVRFGSYRH